MSQVLKQASLLLILAAVIGLGLNLVHPNRIPYLGAYRDLSSGDGPIVPPTAEAGDPAFIAIDVAQMEFVGGQALFIDARDPAEFYCGTIPGSVSIPFEYMPDDNLAFYIDSALGGAAKNKVLITFCSGEECDLSLHLGRNLQDLGYTNVAIFFGGAREWENFDLETQRSPECESY